MKYEDLDKDTQNIIDTMCLNTGKTKEQAILTLVEFGMMGMVAAICQTNQKKIMHILFRKINNDAKLFKTANVYSKVWSIED